MNIWLQKFVLGAVLLVAGAGALADEVLERAQSLLNQDRPREALAVLAPFEGARAGEADYDYLLALATLDSGDAGKAVLVFERVLAVKQDFHGARLDFARALFATARYADAEREFGIVAANHPPPAAQRAIDDYQSRIRQKNRRLKFSRFIDVRTRAGYDTNVNSATELGEFLGFRLNDSSREQDSDFLEIGIGAGGSYRPRRGLTLAGRLNFVTRRNGQASFADTDILVGSLRVVNDTPTQRRVVSLQAFALDIDGEDNNSAVALAGQWEFRLWDRWWLGAAARYGAIRYGGDLNIKDVDQWLIAATASHRFGSLGRGLLRGRIGYGTDDPTQTSSRYARDFMLADLGVEWRFTTKISAGLSASVEDSDYDAIFFAQQYDDPRSDITWRGRGAIDWQFARNWRFNHTLSYALNETDVEIFEYERFEFGLALIYVWQ